jgi:hypothetical protein
MRKKKFFSNMFILSVFLTLTGCHSTTKTAQAGNNKLWEGFINPPQESRPRIWWHWLNGNITANGVQKDLEWMHRIGLGGFHNFDANQFTPQIVTNRLDYMSAPWKLLYKDMITKADSLGFEMGIAGSPGWSESGGPWVSLRESMKKIVWSETDIKGTTSYNGKLPQPPITSGAFQGMPTQAENGWAIPNYYEDIKVLAVRMPDDYISLELLHPRITTSGGGNFTVNQLSNGNYTDGILLPNKEDGSDTWIQYEFDKPQSFCSVLQSGGGRQVEGCYSTVTLQYSTDGSHYTDIAQLPGSGKVNVSALTFKPITARYFRLLFHDTPIPQEELETNPFAKMFGVKNFKTPGKLISEFNLLTIPMINHFIEKAGYSASGQLTSFTTPTVTQKQSIKQSNILDITKQVTTDGTLHWTPPTKGHWKIFRIGYSLTGKVNAPAVLEATGLEVDKLDADAVRRYFNTYLDLYKDATGGKMGNQGIHYMITDSWEAECQNWTPKMEAEFKHLRGYDMNAFFPTLMGYIVESTDKSERFLWDFRKTIGDLIVNNHYGTLTDILRQRGMERYSESHESGRVMMADGMEVKRDAAIPMSAFWTPLDTSLTHCRPELTADVKESASVAHLYGKPLVAAESLTAIGNAWGWSPASLKPSADMELAQGLTRFVLHSNVLQPLDDHKPGIGLGPFGHWFNRHETWAEQAKPWIDYLARSCYMLQQGKFVADVLYYYGDDNNITSLFANQLPKMPNGYTFDFINSDAILHNLSVNNGMLTTTSGATYKVLVLDRNTAKMSLAVLKQLETLVQQGAFVIGKKPVATPSLMDDEATWTTIVNRLWDGQAVTNYGKGCIFSQSSLQDVLQRMQVAADCKISSSHADADLLYVHRDLGGNHIYWIDSRNGYSQNITVTMRVSGMEPQVWDPVTCSISYPSYRIQDGKTTVSLDLGPYDTRFIVFADKAKANEYICKNEPLTSFEDLSSSWSIKFDGLGCQKTIDCTQLMPWNESKDTSIRYYSGTATYTKHLELKRIPKTEYYLDLGKVNELAEVIVNGLSAGILWRAPFRCRVDKLLHKGDNTIQVKVTNLWVNRLIGDEQPGAKRLTWTSRKFYDSTDPLRQSGMLGPVILYKK